jgi:hypothetical protein
MATLAGNGHWPVLAVLAIDAYEPLIIWPSISLLAKCGYYWPVQLVPYCNSYAASGYYSLQLVCNHGLTIAGEGDDY